MPVELAVPLVPPTCTAVKVMLGGNCFTVRMNITVLLAVPLLIVAVRITVASPLPDAGRVTVPVLDTTVVLLDDHEIVVPLAPVNGRVARFAVTLSLAMFDP